MAQSDRAVDVKTFAVRTAMANVGGHALQLGLGDRLPSQTVDCDDSTHQTIVSGGAAADSRARRATAEIATAAGVIRSASAGSRYLASASICPKALSSASNIANATTICHASRFAPRSHAQPAAMTSAVVVTRSTMR